MKELTNQLNGNQKMRNNSKVYYETINKLEKEGIMARVEKEKKSVKQVLKEHKETIVLVAAEVGVCVAMAVVYKKGYKRGLVYGGARGSVLTVDWLDEKFPDTGIKALYKAYEAAHPEEFVNVAP